MSPGKIEGRNVMVAGSTVLQSLQFHFRAHSLDLLIPGFTLRRLKDLQNGRIVLANRVVAGAKLFHSIVEISLLLTEFCQPEIGARVLRGVVDDRVVDVRSSFALPHLKQNVGFFQPPPNTDGIIPASLSNQAERILAMAESPPFDGERH